MEKVDSKFPMEELKNFILKKIYVSAVKATRYIWTQ